MPQYEVLLAGKLIYRGQSRSKVAGYLRAVPQARVRGEDSYFAWYRRFWRWVKSLFQG